jgi:hypothetical protein
MYHLWPGYCKHVIAISQGKFSCLIRIDIAGIVAVPLTKRKARYNSLKEKSKSRKWQLIGLVAVCVFTTFLVVLIIRMEKEAPQVDIAFDSTAFGIERTLSIRLSDEKSGLKKVWIGLFKDGKEQQLLEKTFPASGWLRKGSVSHVPLSVTVKPKDLGLTDGDAMLRMKATDYSWRSWGKGNHTYIERQVQIDTKPPRIDVLTDAHNVSPGGAALVIYQLSEPCPKSGVLVGDNFFPGHQTGQDANDPYLAFFALAHNQKKGTVIRLDATDMAGNQSSAGFYHYIRKKAFRKDTIRISDGFLDSKLPEFEPLLAGRMHSRPSINFYTSTVRSARQTSRPSTG